MGANCCGLDHSGKCRCFDDARDQLQSAPIVRYTDKTWIWSNLHDDALTDSLSTLCTDYEAPHELFQLIKEHAYDADHPHYITHGVEAIEKQRTSIYRKLMKKTLCTQWYSSEIEAKSECISIALHTTNIGNQSDNDLLSSLSDESLPALQMSARDRFKHVRRTVYIDDCQVRCQFIALRKDGKPDIDNVKLAKHATMHVIVVHEVESVNWVNLRCQMIWNETQSMKNVLIFHRSRNAQHKKVLLEVAKYWNIPCISKSATENESQCVKDLLRFMVKYHWFCDVVG